jgi:hypothetical protein
VRVEKESGKIERRIRARMIEREKSEIQWKAGLGAKKQTKNEQKICV